MKTISILNKDTSEVHLVRKIIFGDDGISVWSDTWYGRHIIGKDCDFVGESVSKTEIMELRDKKKELYALIEKCDNQFNTLVSCCSELVDASAGTDQYKINEWIDKYATEDFKVDWRRVLATFKTSPINHETQSETKIDEG